MCLLALMAAAVMVAEDALNGESRPIDKAVLLLIREHVPAALAPSVRDDHVHRVVDRADPLTVAATGLLLLARRRAAALLVAGSVVCAALVVYAMKVVVGRERPALWEVQWYWGSSFPSGHTLVVAAFAMSAALVAGTACGPVRACRRWCSPSCGRCWSASRAWCSACTGPPT